MSKTDVTVTHADSGELKVNIPVPQDKDKATVVGIDPDSQQHEIVVQQTQPERRKNNPATQVIMQAATGGLTGRAATIANMSAVAFVMLLTFLLYTDFRSSVKEQNGYIRDELRLSREANERSMLTLATSLNNVALSNNASMSEFRAHRLTLEQQLNKIFLKQDAK